MGLFSKKDWNVIAVMFETKTTYRVNGNRGKGQAADKVRDGARNHPRTLYWAVFDQKGAFLEGDVGPGKDMIERENLQQLIRDLPTNKTVRDILGMLEKSQTDKAAKALVWHGYPKQKAE